MSKRLRFWIAAARRRFVPGAARRTASRLLDHRISPGATCRARPKRRRAAALQTGGCRLEGGIDYIYDGKRVIQERDTNNTPTVSYTRGNDLSGSLEGAGGIGGLLERADGYNPTNGSWANHNYYHADGNGNVTYLESDSQTLAASYRYDAYGNTLATSGTLAVSNTYRFSSKEFIPTAGLYYYLYRFYDPALQRWVNRDPFREKGFEANRQIGSMRFRILMRPSEALDGPNLYEFVSNDPISRVDLIGLSWMSDFNWCVSVMDPYNACGFIGAPAGAGSFFTTGPLGKVCRRVGAPLSGYCLGVVAGCTADATAWNLPRTSPQYTWTPPSYINAPPTVVYGPR